jgi:peptidoglycan/xylan/chitin deacetylase (PgdA/CDA1 family)
MFLIFQGAGCKMISACALLFWGEEEVMQSYEASQEYVKPLGRTAMVSGVRWCGFSGSGVEFVARTKKLQVTIFGDCNADKADDCARIGIWVDEKRVLDQLVTAKKQIFTIFSAVQEEVHVVRILKLSESAMSTVGIGPVLLDEGSLMPTAKKRFLVEYVGDSITCGYGVDDECAFHGFRTATEDVTKAYACRSAEMLDVDYSCVCLSGHGVLSGYTDSGIINSKELIPPYYEKTGFSYAKSDVEGDGFFIGDLPWNFDERQPDVVVINLGTNDASYCGEDEEKQALYEERYIAFLKTIRKNNPGAYLLCGLGMMGDVLYPAMCRAVECYRNETGDERIDTIYLEPIRPETEGYVADYHPATKTHERIAGVLAEKLKGIFKEQYGTRVGTRVLALTFDDGPNLDTTPKVLDQLLKYQIPASFFLVGQNITDDTAAVVERAFDQGCAIENHSKTHSAMSAMSQKAVLAELSETSSLVKDITGSVPQFFRPPYIAVSDEMRDYIPMTMIAGYGAEDWLEEVTAPMRTQRILSQVRDGAVILLHDASGNHMTVEALDDIIRIAKKQGYHFVTIDNLFKEKDVTPQRGVVYNEAE